MATIQNTLVRKTTCGKALLITITDWEEFKQYEKFSDESHPDLMMVTKLSESPLTGEKVMTFPSEATCFSKKFRGEGIARILRSSVWCFEKVKKKAKTALEEMMG